MGSSSKNSCRTREGKEIRRFMLKHLPKLAKRGDIFIPILGPMGHGKSTCINSLLGPDAARLAPVSGGLEPCTSECALYAWYPQGMSGDATLNGQRIVLIDTPGFDDALSVGEIVSEVASCIQPLPKMKVIFAGAILIMTSFRPRYKVVPVQLPYALGQSLRLVIATTFWDVCAESAGASLEAGIGRVVSEMGLARNIVGAARLIRGRQANPGLCYTAMISSLLAVDGHEHAPGLTHAYISGEAGIEDPRLPHDVPRENGPAMSDCNCCSSKTMGRKENASREDSGAPESSPSQQKASNKPDEFASTFLSSAHDFVINGPVTINMTVTR